MSRDQLIVLVGEQAERITAQAQQITAQAQQITAQAQQITAQDRQITAQVRQIADLDEASEDLAGRLARAEHLLSRNSGQ